MLICPICHQQLQALTHIPISQYKDWICPSNLHFFKQTWNDSMLFSSHIQFFQEKFFISLLYHFNLTIISTPSSQFPIKSIINLDFSDIPKLITKIKNLIILSWPPAPSATTHSSINGHIMIVFLNHAPNHPTLSPSPSSPIQSPM